MPRFTINPVGKRQLSSAWPLIRCAWRDGAVDEWIAFGSALAERGGGVLAAVAEDGILHGVATYEPVDSPAAGKVLRVDLLVAFELTRRAPARQTLLLALDRLAARFGCDAVAVAVPSRGYMGRPNADGHKLASRASASDEMIFPVVLREAR